MSRTIEQIETAIQSDLTNSGLSLSTSKVAEWRLWTWVVATAIHLFEVVLDMFKSEVDAAAAKITPGTSRWYAEQSKRFQNGHELLYNSETIELYYATTDESARIIDIVAVTEGDKNLSIKVAKLSDGQIEPLSDDELRNFTGYIDSIKFAGIQITCISTPADQVRYNVDVIYSPSVPLAQVQEAVQSTIDNFRTELDFNSVLYSQQFISAIQSSGVVSATLKSFEKKSATEEEFSPIEVMAELAAGYFDYTSDCTLTYKTTSDANS